MAEQKLSDTQRFAYKESIRQALELMLAAQLRFVQALSELDERWFNMPPDADAFGSYKERAIEAFQTIYYQEHQGPTESRAFPGVIQVPKSLLPVLNELNTARDTLREVIKTHSGVRITHEGRVIPLSRWALLGTTHERLHNLQATRLIHHAFIDEDIRPDRIGFILAAAPTPNRVTVKEAVALIENRFRSKPQEQQEFKEKLYQLPSNEVIVHMKTVQPRPRVNIAYKEQPELDRQVPGVLPLLIPQGQEWPIIRYRLNNQVTPRQRQRLKLNPEPLVQSPYLELYQYQEPYRQTQEPNKTQRQTAVVASGSI